MPSTYLHHSRDFNTLSTAINQSEANAVTRQAILTTCCTDLLTAINAIPGGGNSGTVTDLPYVSPPGGTGGLVSTLTSANFQNPTPNSIIPVLSINAGFSALGEALTDRDENTGIDTGGTTQLVLYLNIDKPRSMQVSVFTIKFGGTGAYVYEIRGANLHSGLPAESLYRSFNTQDVIGWNEITIQATNSYSYYLIDIYSNIATRIDEIELYGLVTNL